MKFSPCNYVRKHIYDHTKMFELKKKLFSEKINSCIHYTYYINDLQDCIYMYSLYLSTIQYPIMYIFMVEMCKMKFLNVFDNCM